MTKKTFPAKTEFLNDLLRFVDQFLDSVECPMKIQTAICVAIEEVFVNVAHYAYGEGQGDMRLGIFITKKTMDSVTYAYENGENILTMIKTI